MTKEQIITTAVALAAAVLIFTIILMIRRAVRHRKLSIDDMEGHEFEAFFVHRCWLWMVLMK